MQLQIIAVILSIRQPVISKEDLRNLTGLGDHQTKAKKIMAGKWTARLVHFQDQLLTGVKTLIIMIVQVSTSMNPYKFIRIATLIQMAFYKTQVHI